MAVRRAKPNRGCPHRPSAKAARYVKELLGLEHHGVRLGRHRVCRRCLHDDSGTLAVRVPGASGPASGVRVARSGAQAREDPSAELRVLSSAELRVLSSAWAMGCAGLAGARGLPARPLHQCCRTSKGFASRTLFQTLFRTLFSGLFFRTLFSGLSFLQTGRFKDFLSERVLQTGRRVSQARRSFVRTLLAPNIARWQRFRIETAGSCVARRGARPQCGAGRRCRGFVARRECGNYLPGPYGDQWHRTGAGMTAAWGFHRK